MHPEAYGSLSLVSSATSPYAEARRN